VIRAMNYFPDCHREKRSDVAIQLIDCSRGLPQSQGSFAMTNKVSSFTELERTPSCLVIRTMNYFPDCHREKRSDVAIQLIDCSRGLPQSPRLLRNDKRGEFICRSAATKQSSQLDRHTLVPRARDDKQVCDGCGIGVH
jgi:hypothetical protein